MGTDQIPRPRGSLSPSFLRFCPTRKSSIQVVRATTSCLVLRGRPVVTQLFSLNVSPAGTALAGAVPAKAPLARFAGAPALGAGAFLAAANCRSCTTAFPAETIIGRTGHALAILTAKAHALRFGLRALRTGHKGQARSHSCADCCYRHEFYNTQSIHCTSPSWHAI